MLSHLWQLTYALHVVSYWVIVLRCMVQHARSIRSVRPPRPIWRTAYDSDPSTPNSLCALIRFDFRFNGLIV